MSSFGITAYNYDGHYDDTGESYSFRPDGNIHYIGITPGTRSAWLLFTGVTIPQGATIVSATIAFKQGSDFGTTAVEFNIKGNAVDSASAPTSNSDGRSKTRTSASVNWQPPSWVSEGTVETSPDISAVIQEIVNRAGWASGNALQILIDRVNSGSNAYRTFRSYDSSPGGGSESPVLTVTYTTSAPFTPFIIVM